MLSEEIRESLLVWVIFLKKFRSKQVISLIWVLSIDKLIVKSLLKLFAENSEHYQW